MSAGKEPLDHEHGAAEENEDLGKTPAHQPGEGEYGDENQHEHERDERRNVAVDQAAGERPGLARRARRRCSLRRR